MLYSVSESDKQKSIPADQLFAFGSSALSEGSKKVLHDTVSALQADNVGKVIILGHTDSLGNPTANSRLSQERANAVKQYFIEMKFDPSSIIAIGVGDRFPLTSKEQCRSQAKEETIKCLDKNRRVEIWTKPASG